MSKDARVFPTRTPTRTPGKYVVDPGMALRDYFAGQALAGLLARGYADTDRSAAALAYAFADDMMEARDVRRA